ncbi:MAG: DNA mismatch repair endonuclease MutL [Oscillospiraceae bacterium]|nr:DNA mismatch repair endonuclease MutL [Oscillospiraceae bacterium]
MPTIRQLDPHVADLIAAGEVVERPASVVKELMENSIDAGASAVTVEIANGGMTLIRVTDDGCGIPADQAATAFLRHATSKISTQFDLEAIGTLGFRGEALAAISAVSRIDLLTRVADAPLGACLNLEAGRVISQEEAGCPTGTTMVVRDLFFNTPARQKFMKKDSAEGAAVFANVQRIALSHPELSVKFIRDGKQELLTPGDSQLKSAVYAVMGRDIALGLLPVKGGGDGIGVSGFVSMPTCCRGSRNYQHFFVNGRYVKSRVMMAGLEEAYKNQKMVGKFPGCVLHLTLRPNEVDVNVHPTKTEVKFRSDQQVFSAVYYAVLSALGGDRSRPQAVLSTPKAADTVTPHQTSFSMRDYTAPRAEAPGSAPAKAEAPKPEQPGPVIVSHTRPIPTPAPKPAAPVSPAPGAAQPSAPTFRRAETLPREDAGVSAPQPKPVPAVKPEPAPEPVSVSQPEPAPEPAPVPVPEPPEEDWVIRGELFHTYVMVEQGEKVLLIDKHAAHERANFDRLKAENYTPMVQELLLPVTVNPSPEEREILLAQLELLSRFGFDVEEFGATALAVRAAPNDVDTGEIEATLLELARRIRVTGNADPAGARDELLHTMACKAAIKGGQKNGPEELEEVAKMVMSGRVRYCPHGRPVAIELTRSQLEKQFKRA